MMMSNGENQLLFPNPEIVVHLVDVTDEIGGRRPIREDSGMRPASSEVNAAPRSIHGSAVRFEHDVQISGLARGDLDVLRRNLEAVIHDSHRVLAGREGNGAAPALVDGLTINKDISLSGPNRDFQLSILREAGGCRERNRRHEGEQASESSH